MDFGTSRTAAFAVAAVALAACTPARPGPPGAADMGVRSFFGAQHLCSLGVSPPVEFDDVPAGTARYRLRFVNISVLVAPPRDFEVAAGGDAIAEGAIDGWRGPCPGEFQSFSYRLEAVAVAADGKPLAYGQTTLTAVSTTRLTDAPPGERPRMPERRPPRQSP
jgi:hypothetical protein